MPWPEANIPETHLDNDSDSPLAARPDLLAAVQAVNKMREHVSPYMQSLLSSIDAAAARNAYGLGGMAVQQASAVAVTGGTIEGAVLAALACKPGVALGGWGMSGIQCASSSALNVGTRDFCAIVDVELPDWTPGAAMPLMEKLGNDYGYRLGVNTAGKIFVSCWQNPVVTYTSTVAAPLSNNTRAIIGASIIRSSAGGAGSVIFTVNGAQLGAAVAIPAAAPVSLDNAGPLNLLGESYGSTVSYPGRIFGAWLFNRALSADEHLEFARNGLARRDKYGRGVPIHSSDFSVGTGGYASAGGTAMGNVDAIGGEDNWLRATASGTVLRVYSANLSVPASAYRLSGQYIRIQAKIFLPSSNSDGCGVVINNSITNKRVPRKTSATPHPVEF